MFSHFWPTLLGPGCQLNDPFFDSNFFWKLGCDPCL